MKSTQFFAKDGLWSSQANLGPVRLVEIAIGSVYFTYVFE